MSVSITILDDLDLPEEVRRAFQLESLRTHRPVGDLIRDKMLEATAPLIAAHGGQKAASRPPRSRRARTAVSAPAHA